MMNSRIHTPRPAGAFVLTLLALSCGSPPSETATDAGGDTTSSSDTSLPAPTVLSNAPTSGSTDVRVDSPISATFSEAMDPATLSAETFTLTLEASSLVPGTVSYADSTAVFLPSARLSIHSAYSAAIMTGVRSEAGGELEASYSWSFITGGPLTPTLPVALGAAGNFAILAGNGIATADTSAVTGDIGVSPAPATALTGFALTLDPSNVFSSSEQITGSAYAADHAPPTPSNLTAAVGDMQQAFADAAARTPDATEFGGGILGDKILGPGVYQWGANVLIPTDVTLAGSASDVWIFQVGGDLVMNDATHVFLADGARPGNVVWLVSGGVELGATAHCEGVVLTQTSITLREGASINGRLLAQTTVEIDGSTVVGPSQ